MVPWQLSALCAVVSLFVAVVCAANGDAAWTIFNAAASIFNGALALRGKQRSA